VKILKGGIWNTGIQTLENLISISFYLATQTQDEMERICEGHG
jgi:hypothetical protein